MALKQGADVMAVYPFSTVIGVLTTVLIWRTWPKDESQNSADTLSGLSFFQSVKEMAERPVLLRVILLGAVASAATLYIVLVGLVFTQTPGRGTSDAALYVGLVAGAEVPFMLLVPHFWRPSAKVALIAWGTAFYCIHLLAIAVDRRQPRSLAAYPARLTWWGASS